jgi:hypothetical protein
MCKSQRFAKTQLTKMLREAECQCLLWEVEVKNGVAGASDQLSKWEAAYDEIEGYL